MTYRSSLLVDSGSAYGMAECFKPHEPLGGGTPGRREERMQGSGKGGGEGTRRGPSPRRKPRRSSGAAGRARRRKARAAGSTRPSAATSSLTSCPSCGPVPTPAPSITRPSLPPSQSKFSAFSFSPRFLFPCRFGVVLRQCTLLHSLCTRPPSYPERVRERERGGKGERERGRAREREIVCV